MEIKILETKLDRLLVNLWKPLIIISLIIIYDHEVDSLKIASYQKKIGKQRLKEMVIRGMEEAIMDCKEDGCYLEIPTDSIDYQNIRLKVRWDDELVLYPQISNDEKLKP